MVMLGERASAGGGWVGQLVGWLECVERKARVSGAKAGRLNYFLALTAGFGTK